MRGDRAKLTDGAYLRRLNSIKIQTKRCTSDDSKTASRDPAAVPAPRSEASDAQKPAPPISLKASTRLVREWRGITYTVLVHADGFEWNGRRYRSLTIVARAITGAHWSGPRFFGLRKRAGRSVESAEGEHAEA
jgi:hypothetical protein